VSGPRRDPAEQLTKTPGTAAAGERRYTEEELALILNRAAERQDGMQASAARYSLAEIQEIAAGAGISRDHVASVATSLRNAPTPVAERVLGGPSRFRFDESIEGELSDDAVAELLEVVRRELGVQGEATATLGSVGWEAKDGAGSTQVAIVRRGGRTSIGIGALRGDAEMATWMVGGMSAVFSSGFGVIALAQELALATPFAMVSGLALGMGGSWLVAHGLWRRYSRRTGDQIGTLGSLLLDTAHRAVENGRTRDGSPAAHEVPPR
jgi:hypothetical protein